MFTSVTSEIHTVPHTAARGPLLGRPPAYRAIRPALLAPCRGGRRVERATRVTATASESTPNTDVSAFTRVKILSEALPYLQKFRGKTVVIKYGGAGTKPNPYFFT